jgi:2-C-methyl-D-erythritol 4-phosphate cytidylyltransferase
VCVAAEWIDQVFAAASESGAAIPVVQISATLKRLGQDKVVTETVSREGLYLAQTPQVFKKDVITSAYAKLKEKGADLVGLDEHTVTGTDKPDADIISRTYEAW